MYKVLVLDRSSGPYALLKIIRILCLFTYLDEYQLYKLLTTNY